MTFEYERQDRIGFSAPAEAETAIQAIGGSMMGEGRQVLTDDMWERIQDMLPGRKDTPGVTAADSRPFPEAVPWRTRTGAR